MYTIYSMFKDIISFVLLLDHLNVLKILCCFLWRRVAWCVDFDLKRKKRPRFYTRCLNTWYNFWFGDFRIFLTTLGWTPFPHTLNGQILLKNSKRECRWSLGMFVLAPYSCNLTSWWWRRYPFLVFFHLTSLSSL